MNFSTLFVRMVVKEGDVSAGPISHIFFAKQWIFTKRIWLTLKNKKKFKSTPLSHATSDFQTHNMDIAVAADRGVYIEAISTVSPYDDQHTEAAKFCFHRKVGSRRGLSSMYAGSPGIWPDFTLPKFEARGKYSWCYRAEPFISPLEKVQLGTSSGRFNGSRALSA